MLMKVSDRLRKCAFLFDRDAATDSPYENINIYQQRTDPSSPGAEVGFGPPSMYNDLDPKNDRLKNVEDIRRQGERPLRDIYDQQQSLPVTVTVLNDGKTDAQGEPTDNVPARGMGDNWEQLNRDTYRSEGPGGQLVE